MVVGDWASGYNPPLCYRTPSATGGWDWRCLACECWWGAGHLEGHKHRRTLRHWDVDADTATVEQLQMLEAVILQSRGLAARAAPLLGLAAPPLTLSAPAAPPLALAAGTEEVQPEEVAAMDEDAQLMADAMSILGERGILEPDEMAILQARAGDMANQAAAAAEVQAEAEVPPPEVEPEVQAEAEVQEEADVKAEAEEDAEPVPKKPRLPTGPGSGRMIYEGERKVEVTPLWSNLVERNVEAIGASPPPGSSGLAPPVPPL